MSYHTTMSFFENSIAASKFIQCVSHIRLYQGGGKAEEFNQAIKTAAENDGDKIRLSEARVIEIAKQFDPKHK